MSEHHLDKALEIFFLYFPLGKVLENRNAFLFGKGRQDFRDAFVQSSHRVLPRLSEDEKIRLFRLAVQSANASEPNVFHFLYSVARDFFADAYTTPELQFNQFLRWKSLSLQLGEDLLTTVFLSDRIPKHFCWAPSLSPADHPYQDIFKAGLSENHFHLNASGPVFAVTWIKLMNRVTQQFKLLKGIESGRLHAQHIHNEHTTLYPLHEKVLHASALRVWLFHEITSPAGHNDPRVTFFHHWFSRSLHANLIFTEELSHHIHSMGIRQGGLFGGEGAKREVADYALSKSIMTGGENEYFILAGERWLLWSCFQNILQKKCPAIFMNRFYIYLLIKAELRMEFAQTNKLAGFSNFKHYQDRKDFSTGDDIYGQASRRMALIGNRAVHRVESIEARIGPKTFQKDIEETDALTEKKFDQWTGKPGKPITLPVTAADNKPYFFVLHFFKQPDEVTSKHVKQERNFSARNAAKKQAEKLARVLREDERPAHRIYGIDAASSEIGCRPEVFGPVFRYLRNLKTQPVRLLKPSGQAIPLQATYHVGEDFFDLVDGLRAIDEAIEFLDLKSGDRIGHALALGLDARKWYQKKGNLVLSTRQDRLDDLAWMIMKIDTSELTAWTTLRQELLEEFFQLFKEVYPGSLPEETTEVVVKLYSSAWKLRGDTPSFYTSSRRGYAFAFSDQWNAALIRSSDSLDSFRANPKIVGLLLDYHYRESVKATGRVPILRKVHPDFIRCVHDLQNCMMKKIAEQKIAIECNPTSNVLIGQLDRYDEHPIFRFADPLTSTAAISVSVNTDDMGIFETCLPNEYLLLAQALEKQKDDKGVARYDKKTIAAWLEKLHAFSNRQTFRRV